MHAYHLIGLMSGTSLDGIDLCYAKFETKDSYTFDILKTVFFPYSKYWKEKLTSAENCSALEFNQISSELGKLFAQTIDDFCRINKIETVDAVASHGHTIFHQPSSGFTTQIGTPAHIYAKTGFKVISDFRSVDVALGGQGAPLVPIGDRLLFSNFDFRLNLGGIANVSFEEGSTTKAFDICLCNMPLNYLVRKLDLEYDENGNLASSGKVNEPLLEKLNQFPFLFDKGPKSLGKEEFVSYFLPLIESSNQSTENLLATFIEHSAIQIGEILSNGKTLISGGGCHNSYLLERIKFHSTSKIIVPSRKIVDFKEALIFAFLGYLKLIGKPNALKSVTGASRDSIGGSTIG